MLFQVEDRPIIKEIKTYIREHHPIEKEFVVETRPTGKFTYLAKTLLILLQAISDLPTAVLLAATTSFLDPNPQPTSRSN